VLHGLVKISYAMRKTYKLLTRNEDEANKRVAKFLD